MPGIFPEPTSGGIEIRDEFGICLSPPNVSNYYCPPGNFLTSCNITALPSDCTARITAAQINAFQSEMLCLAVTLNPDGHWNCGGTCNLSHMFTDWMTGVYEGSLTDIINQILIPLIPEQGIPDAPDDGQQYARQSGTWSVVIVGDGGGGGGGFPDAPINGKMYGRKNGTWQEVPPDPPVDGVLYGRKDGAWVAIVLPEGIPGEIRTYAMGLAPTGFVKANGASLDTTVYAALFANIGYQFGGSGPNFNVPDLRGEFDRGWDDGRGIDPGRVFGSLQLGGIQSHGHAGTALADGYHNHGIAGQIPGGGTPSLQRLSNGGSGVSFFVSNNGEHTHVLSIGATGGSETRPRNVALLKCIRY